MKLVKKLIENLEIQLRNWLGSKILDYKIIVQVDATLELRLLVPNEFDEAELFELPDFKGHENIILISQVTENEYGANKFKENERKDYYSHRRRFSSLIEPDNNVFSEEEKKNLPSIITFYSYKGGLGRTTALACFAAYMARIKGKKVVVVDCDFEAPGFSSGNYFFTEENNKCGVVEYLLDKEFNSHLGIDANSDRFSLRDYTYTDISEEFISYTDKETKQTTQGELYIIPSGNTQDQTTYLESLARIDLGYDLKGFIEDIIITFDLKPENSLILFDSRTGFNDTFAALAEVSRTLVGIFGINQQNKAGIEFFIDHFYQNGEKKVFFVKGLAELGDEEALNEIIAKILLEKEEVSFDYKVTAIDYHSILKNLGAEDKRGESIVDKKKFELFLNDIEASNTASLKTLFNKIWDFAKPQEKKIESPEIIRSEVPPLIPVTNTATSLEDKLVEWRNISIEQATATKIEFLQNIQFPQLAAEEYQNEQIAKEFLFRTCMHDIFNKSKFILLGSKGAGKTFLYQILNDGFSNTTITKLCTLANKKRSNFIFINTIDANEPKTIIGTHNNVQQFTRQTYDAYWKMLSCYAIFSNPTIHTAFPFEVDFNDWIKSIIRNDLSINQDLLDSNLAQLRQIERFLKENNKKIILSFDKLDKIIPLANWRTGISALLDFWGKNPDFNHILPKIFIRADLFNAEQIFANNIETLKKYSVINIAWEKEELFAHFFKIALLEQTQRERFYQYLVAYHYQYNDRVFGNVEDFILSMENSINQLGQLPIIEEDFRKLVTVIFDETADYNEGNSDNYPFSYDWFFANIQDGLGQTNLRSFWKLIEDAIRNTDKSELSRNTIKTFPLISPKFYTEKRHRESAATVFYNELKSEEGNASLIDFNEFFNDATITFDRRYKYFEMEFKNNIINLFIQTKPNTEILSIISEASLDRQIEGVIRWLVNNGLIKEVFTNEGKYTKYIFPYFYRALFNLKG